MYRLSQTTRLPTTVPRPTVLNHRAASAAGWSSARSGRALTEVLLIVFVPCLCFLIWTVFDKELKQSLLAGPNPEQCTALNAVFGLIPGDDGTAIALQGQGQVRFWDLKNGQVLGNLQSQMVEIRFGAYSASQRLLAIGSVMGQLEVWNVDNPEGPIAVGHDKMQVISCCQFTPDGETLICAGDRGSVSFWNAQTLQRVDFKTASNLNESARCLQITDDGKLAIVGLHSGAVQVWNIADRNLVRTFQVTHAEARPESSIEAIGLVPGSTQFVVATRTEGVVVGNFETGTILRRATVKFEGIRSGSLSADGSRFVTGNDLGQICVWDVQTCQALRSITLDPIMIRAIACDEKAENLISGDWIGQIALHPTTL